MKGILIFLLLTINTFCYDVVDIKKDIDNLFKIVPEKQVIIMNGKEETVDMRYLINMTAMIESDFGKFNYKNNVAKTYMQIEKQTADHYLSISKGLRKYIEFMLDRKLYYDRESDAVFVSYIIYYEKLKYHQNVVNSYINKSDHKDVEWIIYKSLYNSYMGKSTYKRWKLKEREFIKEVKEESIMIKYQKSKEENLVGNKYGMLEVLKFWGRNEYKNIKWMCRCECGKTKIIYGSSLKQGFTKSCGCLHKKLLSERRLTHGASFDSMYVRVNNIHLRCNDLNSKSYPRYGGRGIKCLIGDTVSEIYYNLIKIEGYFEGSQIDRINNEGHYELGNLRWVTPKENSLNRSTTKPLNYYETNPIRLDRFKDFCKSRGLNFDDYTQVVHSKEVNSSGKSRVKYFFY